MKHVRVCAPALGAFGVGACLCFDVHWITDESALSTMIFRTLKGLKNLLSLVSWNVLAVPRASQRNHPDVVAQELLFQWRWCKRYHCLLLFFSACDPIHPRVECLSFAFDEFGLQLLRLLRRPSSELSCCATRNLWAWESATPCFTMLRHRRWHWACALWVTSVLTYFRGTAG